MGTAEQRGAGVRDAEVPIVGGGAVGCAVAYVLSLQAMPISRSLSRAAGRCHLGQAAGLVGQVRATRERCRLAMASVATYSRLERETGYTADWRQTGSVRIAMTGERAAEFRELAGVARSAGLEVEFLTPARRAELCPVLDGTWAEAALWCPTDGYLQPNSLVMAYAGAARERGVTFATRTTVTGIGISGGAVTGVRTDRGAAATSMLMNAAGPWAASVAALAGLEIPAVPVRHEYFVTRPVTGWHGGLPVLRIPDIRIYVRAEGPGILCGGWGVGRAEPGPAPGGRGAAAGRPAGLGCPVRVRPGLRRLRARGRRHRGARGLPRVPGVLAGRPVHRRAGTGIRGLVMAAACNAHGVSGSAGLAEHVLESLQRTPASLRPVAEPGPVRAPGLGLGVRAGTGRTALRGLLQPARRNLSGPRGVIDADPRGAGGDDGRRPGSFTLRLCRKTRSGT